MKRTVTIFFFAFLMLVGCNEACLDDMKMDSGMRIFYASFEKNSRAETKTYVDDVMTLRWTKNDKVSIFVGNTFNQVFMYEGETGANNGSLSSLSNPGFISADPLCANYAVYPYSSSNEMDSDGEISVVLPSVQQYAKGSFGLGANTMVAVTDNENDNFLHFKNVCGYLVVKLYGIEKVKSVKLESNNGEKISGKASIQVAHGTNPTVLMSDDAATSITIDCGEGVDLCVAEEKATEFWFCIPPVTFSKGFTITAKNIYDEEIIAKSVSSSHTVIRNIVNTLSPERTCWTWTYLGEGEFFDQLALMSSDSYGIAKCAVLQSPDGSLRYRIVNPYADQAQRAAAWDAESAKATPCNYIEFWVNDEVTMSVTWNSFWLTGLWYSRVPGNDIKAYLPSIRGSSDADCRFIEEKLVQFTPYYYIDGVGGFGMYACYLSMPGGPDLEEWLDDTTE